MPNKLMRFFITMVAVAAAVVHFVNPKLAIDAISVTLLLVAVLPWLQPLFKSLELPGGIKVEFQELKKVEERADAAGLLAAPSPSVETKTVPTFLQIASSDPNLALAGRRIEIERKLEVLARSRGETEIPRGIGRLLQFLNQKELIGGNERAVLSDLVDLLNSAVHGASVDPATAALALDTGSRILDALDERATQPMVKYSGIVNG